MNVSKMKQAGFALVRDRLQMPLRPVLGESSQLDTAVEVKGTPIFHLVEKALTDVVRPGGLDTHNWYGTQENLLNQTYWCTFSPNKR